MIYKWNELDYYHFNEFLQKFADGDVSLEEYANLVYEMTGIKFVKGDGSNE